MIVTHAYTHVPPINWAIVFPNGVLISLQRVVVHFFRVSKYESTSHIHLCHQKKMSEKYYKRSEHGMRMVSCKIACV